MSAAAELKRLTAKAKREKLENRFIFIWKAIDGPKLEREFRFDLFRKWRFDFADPVLKIAVEIEGGQWCNGAHNRGGHFEEDAEKYFAASMGGWQVIRIVDKMLTKAILERLASYIRSIHLTSDKTLGA